MKRPYYEAPRTNLHEKMGYEQHLKALAKPFTKIDNAAPHLPGNTYIKVGRLEADIKRLVEWEYENREIVKKLNYIGRNKSQIDHILTYLMKRSNFRQRQRRNREIEAENKKLYPLLIHAKSKYQKDELLRQYQEGKTKCVGGFHDSTGGQKITWTLTPAGFDPARLNPAKRIRCYCDVAVKNQKNLGRLLFEIWMDIAPVAGCNFLNLIKGYDGFSYKNTPLHQIVKGAFCVGGDVVNKSGTGVYSVYGGLNTTFGDENNILQFNGPGVLAAHTVFAGDNHSQFLLTFRKMSTMNKNFVVFGRIIGSTRILELIEGYGTKSGVPSKEIVITKSGFMGSSKVPKPVLMKLPPRISPASSEEKLTLTTTYDPLYRIAPPEKLDNVTRRHLIKEDRRKLKELDFPFHKLRMPPEGKKFDCMKLFRERKKDRTDDTESPPRPPSVDGGDDEEGGDSDTDVETDTGGDDEEYDE